MDRFEHVVLLVLGGLVVIVALVLLSAFVMSWAWGAIVPIVFAGAVRLGLLPAAITLVQAIKLSILFWALGVTGATASSSTKLSGLSVSGCIAVLVIAAIIYAVMIAISGVIVHFVWGWVVPDVFASAVTKGFLPATLSWWYSCLVVVLFSLLGLSNHTASSKKD